jgi:sporulation protein YlmC with PRC-barrel domain
MLKKHMAACLVATAFVAAPALAQTSAPPAASPPAGASASAQSGQFMTTMQPNQIRASKFSGVDIIGANNESIGDVNDVILDQQGMAQAVVIGVGGFLGIGEKNVAVPFKSVDWKWERREPATTAATRPAGPAGGATTTGSTAATGTAAGTTDAMRGAPDHGVLRMTKADLQNAPSFSWDGRASGAAGTTGAGGTAPRQ